MINYFNMNNAFSPEFGNPSFSQYFDDVEPELKPEGELFMLLLRDAGGIKVSLRKYNEHEIKLCARKMILDGYLRGTVFDNHKCIWSKPTRKGYFILNLLEKEQAYNEFEIPDDN